MPANRIDWQAIKGSIINQDDAVLFVLPDGFRQLVLSTVDSLGWEATYRINNYDYADFDTLQATVAAGVSGLMDGVMLQDIIGYIDELETLLTAIRDKSCCNDGTINYLPADEQNNTGTTIDPDVGDPPTDYGDTPITTWADWHEYVCEAAYWVIEYLAQMLERLADFEALPAALTVEQIKTLLYRIPLFGVLISEAWAVFAGVIQLAWDNIADMQEAADNIRSAADTIACAFVSADGAAAAGAAMKDAVQTAVTGFWASGLVQFLPYEQYANWIYTGTIVDADGVPHYLADELLPGAHTCCPGIVYDFDFTYDFAASAQSMGLNKAVWTADRDGSIKCDPSWQGWTYIDTSEGNILSNIGLPTNTYLLTQLVEITLERYAGTPNGTPDIQSVVFGESANDTLITEYNTLSSGVEVVITHEPTANDAKYCQTGSSTGFYSIRLTRDGDPNPGMWVKSLRLAGAVNP